MDGVGGPGIEGGYMNVTAKLLTALVQKNASAGRPVAFPSSRRLPNSIKVDEKDKTWKMHRT